MSRRKKVKPNTNQQQPGQSEKFQTIFSKLKQASKQCKEHEFGPLLHAHRSNKHPILPVLHPQNQVYKINPDKKKKPIQTYLDTVNIIYRKKDLDILVNPLYVPCAFEKWSPLEIAIFEESILKFGKQFEFLSELIGSKSPKDVYQFYLQWKGTNHFKSYKAAQLAANRANYQEWV